MAVTADKLYATILKGVGGLYTVRPDLVGEDVPPRINCSARGKLRSGEETPYPGDRVELECSGGAWAIARILERKNALRRPTVANVTHLAAVIPAARPKPDLMTADKLILYAESAGIEPIVVVNKSDLAPDYARHIAQVYENAGYLFQTGIWFRSIPENEGAGAGKRRKNDAERGRARESRVFCTACSTERFGRKP